MPDIIDQANTIVEQTITHSLARAPKFDAPSAAYCIDCDEPIPTVRQRLGGVMRCIDCQNHIERFKRLQRQTKG
ncbi:TraR/DksA C4-type zinc finger protein [Moraxella atlantae]|uniref:Phage/conjugal plasmid C-4 type zinc finger protein, TraR family n=1 Tax=Faucicola atlantae TaxID=34059 RepID=A0A378Q2V2_9GAMM|nr:TraR/DksA C4-type zinc finger protein [Moraxella atlantae]OPH35192.1 hypothetical protein B5J92_05945 [Moraxella atlantae]STY95089.1 phage/conjugal plasmid C-4 type zinc finger protein, TraR family [Moraxella atlantae]